MRTKALLLLLATLVFAGAPFLTPPFTGYDPTRFPVPIDRPSIQPAGYAFAIWGMIYLWLILHAAFGLVRRADSALWDRPRLPLTLAVAIGAAWLWIAGQSAIWGSVTIWMMAAAAITAFLRAETDLDRWLLSAPTAIFAGWLTAATAVSTGVLIAGYGWLGDTASAVAMLSLALGVATLVQRRQAAMPVYGLTVIWALAGVMMANAGANATVAALASAGIALMGGVLWANRA